MYIHCSYFNIFTCSGVSKKNLAAGMKQVRYITISTMETCLRGTPATQPVTS